MESITPHYVSLSLLKFPDIVKLNTIIFTMKSFQMYPHFEPISGDVAPALFKDSFGIVFRN